MDYVDGGGSLEGHDDVPDDIHRDLILGSQIGRKSKKWSSVNNWTTMPPIQCNSS